ncbi:hypothetical protein SmJEL517_g02763 [Synchytrium microbalum]|uniref:Tyrosine specific protein phosphatases domain-containing protein n=1 Tax=Synchytrium microbalum TaxID=1806994 RepID=A0A507C5D1_9FUNG|nr:uncharacterized protein SmJEL517_g02763 [Synchytrium microbalum]TPX34691.1 hypothetical protein SmJEL517_g02763 [Synchytrium microbalum]
MNNILPFTSTLVTWIAGLTTIGTIAFGLYYIGTPEDASLPPDPVFIQEHSKIIKLHHNIRIVYKAHKLGHDVPLIVFVHGLGGNLQQWDEQMIHFNAMAPVLGMDLVGHGRSEKCTNLQHYKTSYIADEIVHLIKSHYGSYQKFVFIGHSYGCCLLTSLLSRHEDIKSKTLAVSFIAPKYQLTDKDVKAFKRAIATPSFLIDIVRWFDRRGGIHSHSVERVLASGNAMERAPASVVDVLTLIRVLGASTELRERQLRWNKANTTSTVKRCAAGLEWVTDEDYKELSLPLLLIVGEDDRVTPIDNVEKLYTLISKVSKLCPEPYVVPATGHSVMCEKVDQVAAFISGFLVDECKIESMSLKDQILRDQRVAFEKWSLKNYAKWFKIQNVSALVGRSRFRGMKVLKQDDAIHTPKRLAQDYPQICGLIDISLDDQPPYDIADFANTGIEYIKLPTISKIPPAKEEVAAFIKTARAFWKRKPTSELGVHCHYGFNRTGFLIVSYLIEEDKYSVSDAIAAFAAARPPGIKHLHFKDALYTRYEAPLARLHQHTHPHVIEADTVLGRALSDLDL